MGAGPPLGVVGGGPVEDDEGRLGAVVVVEVAGGPFPRRGGPGRGAPGEGGEVLPEDGALPLEPRGVGVGHVVGDGLQVFLLRDEGRDGDPELSHGRPPGLRTCFMIAAAGGEFTKALAAGKIGLERHASSPWTPGWGCGRLAAGGADAKGKPTGAGGSGESFEEALKELDGIVGRLESKEFDLDEGLELFEKGVLLYKRCKGKLDKVEKRIAKLSDDLKEELLED